MYCKHSHVRFTRLSQLSTGDKCHLSKDIRQLVCRFCGGISELLVVLNRGHHTIACGKLQSHGIALPCHQVFGRIREIVFQLDGIVSRTLITIQQIGRLMVDLIAAGTLLL